MERRKKIDGEKVFLIFRNRRGPHIPMIGVYYFLFFELEWSVQKLYFLSYNFTTPWFMGPL